MSKMLFVILIALSPAFFSQGAKADNLVQQCAAPSGYTNPGRSIDSQIAKELVEDPEMSGFTQGYIDRDSKNSALRIGGHERACPDNQRAYVCDTEGAIYCTVGKDFAPDRIDTWDKKTAGKNKKLREKGPHDDDDPLRGCEYAGLGLTPEPIALQVAPEKWNHDAAKCGFAEGETNLPCKYVYIFRGIKDIGDVKKHQKEIIKKEKDDGFPRSCRSNGRETVRSILGDFESEGEKWLNASQSPRTFGKPQPPPAPPVYQAPVVVTPPAPVDPCGDISAQSNCPRWNECSGQVPAPHMQVCTCGVEDCTKVLEHVANRFKDLTGNSAVSDFMNKNQIRERAQNAIDGIEKFRKDIAHLGPAGLVGTYYQNDLDHCLFTKFRALADHSNSNGTCNPNANTPSLGKVEADLQRFVSNDPISGWDLNAMTEEFSEISSMAVNFDLNSGKIKTEDVLDKIPRGDGSLATDTRQMLTGLGKLTQAPGMVPFTDLATNYKTNAQYFENRAEQRTDKRVTGQGLKEEVNSYNAMSSHDRVCVTAPNSTDDSVLNDFYTKFTNDLTWVRTFAQLNVNCNQDQNHYPGAGTGKYNNVYKTTGKQQPYQAPSATTTTQPVAPGVAVPSSLK